jgi:hypothetical protein
LESEIEALRAAFARDAEDLERVIRQDEEKEVQLVDDRAAVARSRKMAADNHKTMAGTQGVV